MSDDKSEPASTDPSESTSNDPSNVSSADSAPQPSSKEGSGSKKDDKSKKRGIIKSFDNFLSNSADQKSKNSKGNPNETNPVRALLEKCEALLLRIMLLSFRLNPYVDKKIGTGLGSGYDGLKSGAKSSYKYLKDKASEMKNSTDKSTAAEDTDPSKPIDDDLPNDGSAIEMTSISSAASKVDDSSQSIDDDSSQLIDDENDETAIEMKIISSAASKVDASAHTQVKSSVDPQTASDATPTIPKELSIKDTTSTSFPSSTSKKGALKRDKVSVDPLNPVKLTSPTSSEEKPEDKLKKDGSDGSKESYRRTLSKGEDPLTNSSENYDSSADIKPS